MRQETSFSIEAFDAAGLRKGNGGDHFFVAIRGCGLRLRARVIDKDDGTYSVHFKPQSSGVYRIAISLYGEPLKGSPWRCVASAAVPCASRCVIKGDALERAASKFKGFGGKVGGAFKKKTAERDNPF